MVISVNTRYAACEHNAPITQDCTALYRRELGQRCDLLRICTYHFDSYMLVVVQVLPCKQERNARLMALS